MCNCRNLFVKLVEIVHLRKMVCLSLTTTFGVFFVHKPLLLLESFILWAVEILIIALFTFVMQSTHHKRTKKGEEASSSVTLSKSVYQQIYNTKLFK